MYENFVVGEILSVEKHPNADRFTICKVSVGNRILQIVCGAPNATAGQKVCVARDGAIIPNGGFEIRSGTVIRGVESNGILCAEDELGLSTDHTGILVLNERAEAGMAFSEYILESI